MSERITIAMISTPMAEGGVATHLQELVPRLRAKGHKVIFITGRGYEKILEADSCKGYRCVPLPARQYGLAPASAINIIGALKTCDIVNLYGYPNFLTDYLTLTRPFHRKPLVITLAGSFHQYTSSALMRIKQAHNFCMRNFQSSVDSFVAVSQAERHEVIKGGISADKVDVIYSAASEKYLKVAGGNRAGNETKVLYLGRLTASKNILLLIEAIAAVIKQRGNIRLILAGTDFGELGNLQAMVTKLGIGNHVKFVGRVSEAEKMRLFDSSHVFVHPSTQDIFALTILEAAVAGLPGVAFNTGGSSEMIVPGETGLLANNLTAGALAEALLQITENRETLARMGQKARTYVSGKFSWDKTAADLEELYYRVLGVNRSKQVKRDV